MRLLTPPSVATPEPDASSGPRLGPLGRLLIGAALLLVVVGGVLWGLRGEAVFSDTVLAALAWCF